jgi:hypothetical protein
MRSMTVSDDQSWYSIITDQYTAVKKVFVGGTNGGI